MLPQEYGNIVNVSSVNGVRPLFSAVYGSRKGALNNSYPDFIIVRGLMEKPGVFHDSAQQSLGNNVRHLHAGRLLKEDLNQPAARDIINMDSLFG